jgi:hypothetical protein
MYLVPITTLSRQVTSYLSIHVTNVGSEIAREVLIRLYIPFELLVINGGWLTNKVSYGDEDATIYQLFEIYPDIGNKPLVLYPSDSRGLQIISKNLPERLYIGFPDPHAQARKNWNAQFGDATYNIEPEIDYSHPAIHKNIIIELFADRMVMQRNIISISHLIKTAAFD